MSQPMHRIDCLPRNYPPDTLRSNCRNRRKERLLQEVRGPAHFALVHQPADVLSVSGRVKVGPEPRAGSGNHFAGFCYRNRARSLMIEAWDSPNSYRRRRNTRRLTARRRPRSQGDDGPRATPIPKTPSLARGASSPACGRGRRRHGRLPCRLRKPFSIQSRISAHVRGSADTRHPEAGASFVKTFNRI